MSETLPPTRLENTQDGSVLRMEAVAADLSRAITRGRMSNSQKQIESPNSLDFFMLSVSHA
jgi:hypothetical protein